MLRKIFFGGLIISLLGGCGTSSTSSIQTGDGGFSTVATPRRGFLRGEKIDVIVFDVRADKHKGLNLERTIQQHLIKTYPSAWVRVRDSDAFFRKSNHDALTIRVRVEEFGVTQRAVIPQLYSQKTATAQNVDLTQTPVNNQIEAEETLQKNGKANAVMVLITSIDDHRSGRDYRNSTEIRELFPVDIRDDGGYSNNGMGSVFQKSLDRVCGFVDGNLR